MLKSTVLPHAVAKEGTWNNISCTSFTMLASLGFRLRQQCQFLTSAILIKTVSEEGINKNKGDCHQCRIISLLKCLCWKDSFGNSVNHDVANTPDLLIYDDDYMTLLELVGARNLFVTIRRLEQWYSTFFVRVPPHIISLQLCTPKVVGA
jgi:hypothetical protein